MQCYQNRQTLCRRPGIILIPMLVLCWRPGPAAASVRRMDLPSHYWRQQSLEREASRDHIKDVSNWAAADGLILWTLANYGWKEFVYNWVATVRHAEIENFFIAALDDRLQVELKENGIPCVKLHNALGAGNLEWGTDAFKERGREKIRFIRTMLEAGLSPIFSDLDVAWLRNPMPYVRQFWEANVLISTDTWTVSASDHNALDNCPTIMGTDRTVTAHSTFVGKMNVGIHMLRPSAIGFVEAWLEEMVATDEMEQLCWNAVMMRNMDEPSSQSTDKFCRSMEGKIVAGLLPASLFENGLNFFVQRLPANLGVSPFVVHESFIAGTFAKIYHLREALLWQVDPVERFSPDVKLLSVELELGEKVMREAGLAPGMDHHVTERDARGHLELVKQQYIQVNIRGGEGAKLSQVQAAAALAKALNRSLVMPQLWCGLENLWSPHTGRSWGNSSEYRPPTECAMSQLFHLERWEKEAGVRQTLPPLLESSFLSNQHTKIEHDEVLHVTACQDAGDRLCCRDVEACELQLQRLEILEGMKKDDILGILQATKEVRLLKLSHAHKLVTDEYVVEDESFVLAFEAARRDWCCTDKGSTLAAPLSPTAEERLGLAPDRTSS